MEFLHRTKIERASRASGRHSRLAATVFVAACACFTRAAHNGTSEVVSIKIRRIMEVVREMINDSQMVAALLYFV